MATVGSRCTHDQQSLLPTRAEERSCRDLAGTRQGVSGWCWFERRLRLLVDRLVAGVWSAGRASRERVRVVRVVVVLSLSLRSGLRPYLDGSAGSGSSLTVRLAAGGGARAGVAALEGRV